MCFVLDLFQASNSHLKWTVVLLIINCVFTLFYLLFVSILFAFLEKASENWVEYWEWICFGLAVFIWAILMLTITIIWCLCRNYAFKKEEEVALELGEINEKVKKTLGLDQKTHPTETSNLIISKKKPEIDEIKIENAEITPLPEYSPEARSSIFDFSDEGLQKLEEDRSRSPFQDFLHLVQVESPTTPEKPLHEQFLSQLNRISEEPMYDIPLRSEPTKQETSPEPENHDEIPLVEDNPKGTEKKLKKRKSQMFLGNIGKSSSVVSEIFVELNKGSVVPESVVEMGRYQVLSD